VVAPTGPGPSQAASAFPTPHGLTPWSGPGESPAGAFALPVRSDHPGVTVAALGDLTRDAYVVHLVNTGAARPAVITGLPAAVKSLQVVYTDPTHGMQALPAVPVAHGEARVDLPAVSFVSLTAAP
jgi:hypothetical protein